MTLDPETLRWAASNMADNDLSCCNEDECAATLLIAMADTIEELDA